MIVSVRTPEGNSHANMPPQKTKTETETEPPAVRVIGLEKTFGAGDEAVTAIDGVSFEIATGSIVGLLGPNGAGKTTTIESILGLVIPDEGQVEIAGIDVHKHPRRAYGKVGVILEGSRNVYWRLTVRENLEFFAGLGGEAPTNVRERHDRLLELVDLADEADTPVNELSRGMKQKVALVSTLARDVEVVFMDEPTLGLDVEAAIDLRAELGRLADREDVTIILTSHDMDVVEAVCDRLIVLRNGSVLADDAVESLLDLFDARRYRVTLPAPVDQDLAETVETSFGAEVREVGEECHVDVTVTDVEVLYDLLSTIRTNDGRLLDLMSCETDLEDVFLHLVDEDGARSATSVTVEDCETPGVPEVSREQGWGE